MSVSNDAVIAVALNGQTQTLPQASTLGDIVASLGLPERGVAIEVSGAIVPRSRWQDTILKEGDSIEVVHMVGGGA